MRKSATPRRARQPLGASAYERLQNAILAGEYGPGDRILENEIAQRFKISRTPVREAMRRLEDEGFLVHESHRGMTVTQLDHQMTMELYSTRTVLEGAAAAMAARNASAIEIEMLEDLIRRERDASSTPEDMAEHNRRFHLAIFQCSHNRYLLKTLSILNYSLALLSKTAFGTNPRRAAACAEHKAIVEAIRTRDPKRAEKAAQEHMRAAQLARMGILTDEGSL